MPYDPNPYKYNDIPNDPGLENWLANKLKLKRLENINGQGNSGINPDENSNIPLYKNIQPTGTFETNTGKQVNPIPLSNQSYITSPSQNFLNQYYKPQNQTMLPQNQIETNILPPQPDEFSNYWKQAVVGKMPRDQFVQLMGTVAQSLAPNEWSGRLGGNLAAQAGAAYGERMRRQYEAPMNALKTRLTEAQIGHLNAQANALGRPPKVSTTNMMYQDENGNYNWGLFDESGNLVKILRPAVPKEISDNVSIPSDIQKYNWWNNLNQKEKDNYEKFITAGHKENIPTKFQALKEIAAIDYSLAKVAKPNTIIDDKTALAMSQILGRPISGGSLLDEQSRLQYIDSLNKQRAALIPYTKSEEERQNYIKAQETPLSEEEKRNIYRESYGLIKSGAEAAGMSNPTQLQSVKTHLSLPLEIKTTSEAMKYLQSQGMSQDEAINWLRNQ